MSWHLTGWLGEVGGELDHAEFRVLFRLCHCCNQKTGVCKPSIPTIAKLSKMSERTVYRALDSLVAGGWIEVKRNYDERGRQIENSYRINASAEYFYPGGKSVRVGVTPVSGRGDTDGEGGVTPVSPKQRKRTENITSEAKASSVYTAKGKAPKNGTAKAIADDWKPTLGPDTETGKFETTWPPGFKESEVERFVAYHQARGTVSKNWNLQWKTWALGPFCRQALKEWNSERTDDRSGLSPFQRALLKRHDSQGVGGSAPLSPALD